MAVEYGTPYVDFLVQDTGDPKYLVVQDITEYYGSKTKPAIIEICAPGTNNPVTHFINKNGVNVFNSNNLFVNCPECEDNYLDLNDGLWKITIKISPDTFQKTKYYLKMDKLRLDFGKVLLSNDNGEAFERWFSKVYLFMAKAAAAATQGDIQTSKRYYDDARKLVDQNKDCKNCF